MNYTIELVLCLPQKDPPQFDHPTTWGLSLKDLAAKQETLYNMIVWTTCQDLSELGQLLSESVGIGRCACTYMCTLENVSGAHCV